jgi:protein involved in polysaccharide export with SLBB domain
MYDGNIGTLQTYPQTNNGTSPSTSGPKLKPLAPNDFQKFVLQTTGKAYSLFGADFFENSLNSSLLIARAPVSDDYVLGPGDELQIRVWGSTNGEKTLTIDRNGQIAIPKLANITLVGVKASKAEGLIKSQFSRLYKDFDLSVSLGRLRKITIYVVGQSRAPGSYSLGSQSTLTTALFASGGPNSNGTIRKVQVKRNGIVVAEFDLYAFLAKGDKSSDIKLVDGDVVFFPSAAGYVAMTGKVNGPGIYELKDGSETVADMVSLAGGLSVVGDPRRATLERLLPGVEQPRQIQEFSLDSDGLKRQLKHGDVIAVGAIVPELSNAVTLRGNVAQPARVAWRKGLRVSDLINRKVLLMSPDSVRKQNEVMFDFFERERTARNRSGVPFDLQHARQFDGVEGENLAKDKLPTAKPADNVSADASLSSREPMSQLDSLTEAQARDGFKRSQLAEESLVDRIGNLVDEVNLDYAVIERIHRDDLRVSVIPFNLGRVLSNASDPDNFALEPGDVVTVFSAKDIRVPRAKRRVFVKVEGEVNNPGVYPVLSGENLSSIIQKAGGATSDAYLYGLGVYREEVRLSQKQNLNRLLRQLEADGASRLAQMSQSLGAASDASVVQAKIQSVQRAQSQSLERARSLQPEGRIALGLPAKLDNQLDSVPDLRMQNGDRIYLPARPDFVYIFGAINTESALLFKPGANVADYLKQAGNSAAADLGGVMLLRADGSAFSGDGFWRNPVLTTLVMPGDTIVVPEKVDQESGWSMFIRNTKDITQIMYQLGLSAAAIKTLRQ